MSSLWRQWSRKNTEEISPWVGLSFGVLYFVAIAAVGAAALRIQNRELTEERVTRMAQWSNWLGRSVAAARTSSAETLAAEIRRAGREEGVRWCAVTSSDGHYLAHSEADQVGRRAGVLVATDVLPNEVQVAADPEHAGGRVLVVRLTNPGPGQKPEELRVGLTETRFAWARSEIVLWSAYTLPAVLVLFLVCYRMLRRAITPLAAIRQRLVSCQEPAADRLLALRMNDSFDQISVSWNRLIDFVGEMQDQLRRSKLSTDMSAAMDAFHSERLTNILMQLPFGVIVVDAEGKVGFANRTAAGMLGTAGESLEGKLAATLFDESLHISLLAGQGGGRGGGVSSGRWVDHTLKRPHGDMTLRFWSLPAEFAGRDNILIIQDVTQAKEAERARDNFLYHVTHELRTPLTNIRAYAETLSQGVIDDEQTIRECYNVIMGETQRLSRLVEDILNVSQLEVGSARLSVSEVAVDQLIRKVVQDMQGNADAKHLDLVLSLPAKTPKIRGDRERLAVVLINLVGNAIKYTPDGGRVEIDCSPENERLRINVTDTGIGIAPEHQEKIFDKFYRVTDEKVQGIPGTGLGLSIVKETVRLHGGAIFVTSTPGKGSTFSLVLPALPLDGSSSTGSLNAAGLPTET